MSADVCDCVHIAMRDNLNAIRSLFFYFIFFSIYFYFQFGNDQDRHLYGDDKRTVSISDGDTDSNWYVTDSRQTFYSEIKLFFLFFLHSRFVV